MRINLSDKYLYSKNENDFSYLYDFFQFKNKDMNRE